MRLMLFEMNIGESWYWGVNFENINYLIRQKLILIFIKA